MNGFNMSREELISRQKAQVHRPVIKLDYPVLSMKNFYCTKLKSREYVVYRLLKFVQVVN